MVTRRRLIACAFAGAALVYLVAVAFDTALPAALRHDQRDVLVRAALLLADRGAELRAADRAGARVLPARSRRGRHPGEREAASPPAEGRAGRFGGADPRLSGSQLLADGRTEVSAACKGGIGSARSDLALGPNTVRLDGTGWDDASHRRLRRILLVDKADAIVGLAVSGIPGGRRTDWRGYAVTPAGTELCAFGLREGRGLCRLGAPAAVAP